jgi:penicillin-binding protein 2
VLPKKIAMLAVAIGSLTLIDAPAASAALLVQQTSSTPSNAASQPSSPAASIKARAPSRVAAHHPIHRTRYRRRVYRRRASVHRRVVHRAVRPAARRTAALHRTPVRHPVRRVAYRRPVRRVSYSSSAYHHVRYRHALYHRYVPWSPWNVSSINADPAFGDDIAGENPEIRAAALKALGHLNGSVIVVDPNSGRILAMVNQRLALTRGFIPCSTVKPMVALAGLKEGLVTLSTKLPGMTGRRIDMTEALAHSDNRYFAELGEMLGFPRVEQYAELLGYGQRASLDIPDESPGVFPSQPPPATIGGVGRLTSFGTGIDQTPLQMAALASAIANGGTLYWLQWPRTPEEIEAFTPRVRRVLTGLAPYIPEVRQGMAGAVLYGTARLAYNPFEDIFGKTGTCSEDGGRMGWFVSFAQQQQPEYVVIVMLRGGRVMFGPHAAGIAGDLYRQLLPQNTQSAQAGTFRPPALLSHPGQ